MTDSMSTNLTCLRKRYKSGRFRPKIKSVPIPTSEATGRKTEVSRMDHDYSRPPNHGKNIMSTTTSIDEGWSEYDEEDEDELDTSDEDYRGDDRNDDPPDETNEEDTLHPDVSKNLLDWHEGRRVVELGVLAAQLQKGCKKCGTVLHLCDCFQERHYGLGSILYIKCTICSFISNIPTGKWHEKNIWDVNTKLGAGITSSGIGFSNLHMLFASLNIPGVAAGTVKKRDRKAGKAIESVAKKSCNEALDEEIKMNDGKVEIRVAADAGWQTRSSGRKYNSYSGHSSLIGDKSGKIVRYDYRCRKCRLCENAKRKGIQPINHDCRKNWDGSAKAMEPDMIVGMLKDLEKDHIHPHELVMDDDSTTISRARKECEQSITKFSDRNHLKKTFSNKLYDLQRFKKYQQLRGKTMTHLKKYFSYVLAQNQKKPEELKKSLLCIIPHMYGDHLACPSWCKYKRNPASYLPRNLPYSRYLTCPELKKDLEAIIQTYAQQADKLSDLGSTQACESFNHIVASKNPKSLFLSGSESTSFIIAAAVAQKNIGKSYIQEVNDELNMSPGAYTEKAVEKMDRKRKLQKIRQSSAEYKKRRCQIRKSSSQDQGCKEVREGKTYETSVGLEKMDEEQDINSIPSATVEPERIPLRNTDSTFVYFDLETTGLGSSAEILEIGAARGQDIFQKYIKPNGTISANATCVTGLHMKNHELYYRDQKLATTDLKSALQKFSEWLSDSNSNILVSHNGLRFDFPLFIQNIMSQNIVMNTCIAGFIDTLEVFKNSDLKTQTGSFSQESLMRDAGIQSLGVSHCALTDAMDLQNLVNFHNIPFNTLLSQSVMYDYVLQHLKFSSVKNDNLKSLDILVHGKVITEFMANKIAKSGLNMNYIKLAHTRNGEDGVKNLFQEIVNGKARVTKCKKIINSVSNYLSSQL